jgi:hypothetical protein
MAQHISKFSNQRPTKIKIFGSKINHLATLILTASDESRHCILTKNRAWAKNHIFTLKKEGVCYVLLGPKMV